MSLVYGGAIHDPTFWADQAHALVLSLALVEGTEAEKFRGLARGLWGRAVGFDASRTLEDIRPLAIEITNLQIRIAAFMREVAGNA